MAQSTPSQFTPRHYIAITALISCMVALYLHLWKLGLTGPLACTASHGCEKAQYSQYGWFLGIDVAMIGTVGYAMIFVTTLIGVQTKFLNDPRITKVLIALIVPAFLFTLRLKYAEFVILQTFCPWCAISAVTITTHMYAVWRDWKRVAS